MYNFVFSAKQFAFHRFPGFALKAAEKTFLLFLSFNCYAADPDPYIKDERGIYATDERGFLKEKMLAHVEVKIEGQRYHYQIFNNLPKGSRISVVQFGLELSTDKQKDGAFYKIAYVPKGWTAREIEGGSILFQCDVDEIKDRQPAEVLAGAKSDEFIVEANSVSKPTNISYNLGLWNARVEEKVNSIGWNQYIKLPNIEPMENIVNGVILGPQR